MLADTPTSIKHGADMGELVESQTAANDGVMSALGAARMADAAREFRAAFSIATALYTKANEASQYQVNEPWNLRKTRKETSSTHLDGAHRREPVRGRRVQFSGA